MDFRATPVNVVEMLIMVLGMMSMYLLFQKRYSSNIPVLYYIAMVVFITMTEREFQPILFFSGMGFALLLRFEFMGEKLVKIVMALEVIALGLILWTSLAHILGPGLALF